LSSGATAAIAPKSAARATRSAAGAGGLQLMFDGMPQALPRFDYLLLPHLHNGWRWPRITTPALRALAQAQPAISPAALARQVHVSYARAYLAVHGVDAYGGRRLDVV